MVINNSLPIHNPQLNKTNPVRPPAPTAAGPSEAPAALNPSIAPEISGADEAGQTADMAVNSILNQSKLALLAHGNLSAETVFSLLQP